MASAKGEVKGIAGRYRVFFDAWCGLHPDGARAPECQHPFACGGHPRCRAARYRLQPVPVAREDLGWGFWYPAHHPEPCCARRLRADFGHRGAACGRGAYRACHPAHSHQYGSRLSFGARLVFFKIKVPLAFPVSFAGIRTAASEVVASATLAAYIGAGGLGQIIFTGLGLMRTDLLVIGGASVAALSLLVGMLLSAIDRRMRPYEFAKQ